MFNTFSYRRQIDHFSQNAWLTYGRTYGRKKNQTSKVSLTHKRSGSKKNFLACIKMERKWCIHNIEWKLKKPKIDFFFQSFFLKGVLTEVDTEMKIFLANLYRKIICKTRFPKFLLLTFPFSKRWVIITMTWVFCSQTIFQNEAKVPWIGPWVAM